jgi:hypothetical protein
LQASLGLRNIAEADEVGHCGIRLFLAVVLAGRGAQTEFELPDYARSTDTTLMDFSTGADRESSFQGKLIASGSHLSPLGMTYYFACQ